MTRIIEKRRSLHKKIEEHKLQNDILKAQLAQFQALTNIGASTCMIAHEINNLLTPMSNYAAFALENMSDKALVEKALQKMAKNCARASKIMESILSIANGQPKQKQKFELLPLIQEIFDCLIRDFSKDSIIIKIDVPDNLAVNAVPIDIQQVLMNLILNAREAMLANGGVMKISAKLDNDFVKIIISDTGCGIDPNNLKNIFEAFFTTKTDASQYGRLGSGLGLAFVKKVVDEHNGTISVESELNRGTVFTISLPVH